MHPLLRTEIERFVVHHNDLRLLRAALPQQGMQEYYLFDRDALMIHQLVPKTTFLKDQLKFSAQGQATRNDPLSGAVNGRISHERSVSGVPVQWRAPYNTQYNACDTTALYLLGEQTYTEQTGDTQLAQKHAYNIVRAVEHLLSRINSNGEYFENPPSGAERFSLVVSYWRDSILIGRPEGQDPAYPIVYSLAHSQTLAGLRAAHKLTEIISDQLTDNQRDVLQQIPNATRTLQQALEGLYDKDLKQFIMARDQQGDIKAVSTDSLHALAYLEPSDIPPEWATQIVSSSRELVTANGYKMLGAKYVGNLRDVYHAKTLWFFDNAFIHKGAKQFNLHEAMTISSRIRNVFDLEKRLAQENQTLQTHYELALETDGEWKLAGQPQQLWSLWSKIYANKHMGWQP